MEDLLKVGVITIKTQILCASATQYNENQTIPDYHNNTGMDKHCFHAV